MNAPLPRSRALGFMLLGAFIISMSAPFVRAAAVSPDAAGFYRMLFGGIGLLVWCSIARRRIWQGWGYTCRLIPVAVLFALDLYFWHRSIHHIGPGLATLLGNFQVFILALVGWLVHKDRLRPLFLLGVLTAFAGIWLLVGLTWGEVTAEYRLGVMLGLATAAAYAAFILNMRRVQSAPGALSPPANLALMSLACAAIMAGINALEGHSFVIPDTRTLGFLLAYGLFCQVLGWMLITRAMPVLPAALIGAFLLLQPCLSFIWDMLFFDRPTTAVDLIGVAMVLVGIYVANRSYENQ